MPQRQPVPDPDELRAFELRMHYEGVAAFAAGPSPWESWDDAGTLGTWQRLEDAPRRPARRTPSHGTGHRVLRAVTRLLVLLLLVGIGGVYFSSVSRPPELVSSAIQPAPIEPRQIAGPPDTADSEIVAAELDTLPAPAAGPVAIPDTGASPDTTGTASTPSAGNDTGTETPPAPASIQGDSVPTQDPVSTTTVQPVPAIAATTPADNGLRAATPVPDTQEQAAHGVAAGLTDTPAQQQATPVAADTVVAVNTTAVAEPSVPAPESAPAQRPDPLTASSQDQPATNDGQPAPVQTALEIAPAAAAPESAPAHTLPPITGSPQDQADWVVNLAAYGSQRMARKVQSEFRDKGVETELVNITVNNRPMVRIRTSGYRSAREARDWVSLLEERLGLSGVWISKR